AEGAKGSLTWKNSWRQAGCLAICANPGYNAYCGRFKIAFHSCDLSRKEDPLMLPDLHGHVQYVRRIDVGIAMNNSQPHELRILKPRDHPEDSPLLSPL